MRTDGLPEWLVDDQQFRSINSNPFRLSAHAIATFTIIAVRVLPPLALLPDDLAWIKWVVEYPCVFFG